ncbi:MAG: CHAT domain-containing protein [Roseofilum sp. SBFL]|uniref:CHAT domain-containing protein n=1 Tax=unclassified Roseofilum TaxID=2620099 RepID=UPI001B075067|nr:MULTISPECIES: CHAT domain-containing protein [unclassified Roseofilum]MBP0015871.1 CHAT domain-containing protein [Roseofilum sp. SID3]MBP0025228.1 CHAT domain-containing protein [Roseofilum sp. SID2]MBP0038887.1 CHAT domain-containing protein [Roseofilum sp. SID1]MBP0043173.1 CHAT domain-containing protein [Roseofilum sp. SBFL]
MMMSVRLVGTISAIAISSVLGLELPAIAQTSESGSVQVQTDPVSEADALENQGKRDYSQGRFFSAQQFYQRVVKLRQRIGDRRKLAKTLINLASVEINLEDYDTALELLNQARSISQSRGDSATEIQALTGLSLLYEKQNLLNRALATAQQALALNQRLDRKEEQGHLYNHLGHLHTTLHQEAKASQAYHRAISIFRKLGDKVGVANSLNGLGFVYLEENQFEPALSHFYQALLLWKALEKTENYATTLHNMGRLFESQKQAELAILFYKQSMNEMQLIHSQITDFSLEQQKAFLATVSHRYRHLANLLFQNNRPQEAHQVLDLLKLQELDEYLHSVKGDHQLPTLSLHPVEEDIFNDFLEAETQGVDWIEDLEELRAIPEGDRTADETEQLNQINSLYQSLHQNFKPFLEPSRINPIRQRMADYNAANPKWNSHIQGLKSLLQQFEHQTAFVYPFMWEDRLEMIVVFADRPPIRRTVPVSQSELEQKITEFRTTITRKYPLPRVQSLGQQLYEWLVQPIAEDLNQAGIEALVYSPDGQLRHLPFSALYDGQNWLIQQFEINYITATSLQNFAPQTHRERKILAGAFTQGNYHVQVGDRQFDFSGLPFAQKEVQNLIQRFPDHTTLWNQDFNRDATLPELQEHQIVHLATHAAFVQGEPEESFILLGNGDRITLRDIEHWNLSDVDLIVLSACQTGIGEILGNGEEILGLGYQVQKAGAKAAIATLWHVDDRGTQVLMDQFYQSLDTDPDITLAQAIRQAQLSFINAQLPQTDNLDPTSFQHPYYWAPFILIGNGLD